MKLVLFDDFVPGVLSGDNVVDVSDIVADVPHIDGQTWMSGIIAGFDGYRAALEDAASSRSGVPASDVRLRAPLPEPKRMVCMAGNYMENGSRALVGDRDAFLKSPSAVIGNGDTVVLPDVPAGHFHHEAELAIVVGKTANHVDAEDAADYIFGYVNFMDVSAREISPNGNSSFFWQKSWDTFAPMGPWIDTDFDPAGTDMGRTCEEVLEFASWITTLQPGDVVSTGTNHVGLGPIQDGDVIDMEIEGLERLTVNVEDAWKRTWPRKTLSQMSAFESSVNSKRL